MIQAIYNKSWSQRSRKSWQLPESGSQRSRSSYFTTTWSGSQRSIRSYLTTTWGMEPGIKKLVLDKLPEPGSQPSRRSHLTTTWVWEPAIKKIILDYAAVQPINPRDKRGLKIATHDCCLIWITEKIKKRKGPNAIGLTFWINIKCSDIHSASQLLYWTNECNLYRSLRV